MQLMKLSQSYDRGDSLSLEAVLLRKLEKACALEVIQGEVSRHPLLILYVRFQLGLGQK